MWLHDESYTDYIIRIGVGSLLSIIHLSYTNGLYDYFTEGNQHEYMMNHTLTIFRIGAGYSLLNVVHLSYTNGRIGNFTFGPVVYSQVVHTHGQTHANSSYYEQIHPEHVHTYTPWIHIHMWPDLGKPSVWDFFWKSSLMYGW